MRIAMISMHTSPIEQPGIGDAGGMNVYVLNIARQLAKQGIGVDIFTRATRSSQPEVMQLADNLRVINIIAGPYVGLEKNPYRRSSLLSLAASCSSSTKNPSRRPSRNPVLATLPATHRMMRSIPIIGFPARSAGCCATCGASASSTPPTRLRR